jgi:periplasmic mercuric ion binding protein
MLKIKILMNKNLYLLNMNNKFKRQKMKKIIYFLISLVVLSCNSESKKEITRKEHVKTQQDNSSKVNPNKQLTIEIDGMSCVMGCGSSIRKELYATKGVSEVEFDFEEERTTNIAKIKFDKDLVTVDEMVRILNTMNENQFKVGKTTTENIEISHLYQDENSEEEESHTSEKPVIKTSSNSIETSSFVNLLSRFFTKNIFKF